MNVIGVHLRCEKPPWTISPHIKKKIFSFLHFLHPFRTFVCLGFFWFLVSFWAIVIHLLCLFFVKLFAFYIILCTLLSFMK